MDKEAFLKILKKYRAGEATEDEAEFLQAYYNLFEVQDNVFEKMDLSSKLLLKEEIKSGLHIKIGKNTALVKQSFWNFNRIAVAAAVLIILGIASYFVIQNHSSSIIETKKFVDTKIEDIAPGGNHAMLTLSDGSVIKLDDQKNGQLFKEAGAMVSKTKDGEIVYSNSEKGKAEVFNTIRTPRGGQYQLTLTDGTRVWLNAASSIKFPTAFGAIERRVDITGEAYFEVAKNKNKPFRVFSKNQEIEVLGTHFNVNTYEDEQFDKTTLLEGSVKVYRITNRGLKKSSEIIKPGEVAIVEKGKEEIGISHAISDEAVAWKNGYFKFSRTDLKTIMRQVSRWYNVDVIYKDDFKRDLFGGKIKRTDSVSGVLRILKLSNINTTIKGRTIIISN